ncbi:hypothetical protein [Halorubrum aethiopicum]|uniref:hypothetical protein n=1 Tax=Halorubrum aethiopicum TaxID=1758255 RepID=UPI000A81F54C|nr:hypothetical protein [Halorubrum aethiopicum]
MAPLIESQPSILFDNRLNEIKDPNEMYIGDLFYIFQNEPIASGEPVRNPFDVGPGLFNIPDIENQGIRDSDLLLVRVTNIESEHVGTCRIEVEVEDANRILDNYQNIEEAVSSHDFTIPNRENPLDYDEIRGTMNTLVKDIQ